MWKETWPTSTQEAKVVRRRLKYPALRSLAPRLQCSWQHLQHNLLSSWPTWCTETTRNIKPRSSTRPNDVRQHLANQRPESDCWTRYCIWCQALLMGYPASLVLTCKCQSWKLGIPFWGEFQLQEVLSNWSHQWPLCLFSKCCHFFGKWQVWISQPRSSTFWASILSFNNRWTSQSDLLHLGLNLFLSAISGTRFLVQWDLVLLHSWFVPLNIFMFYTFSSGCEVDASSPRLPILQFCIRDQPVTANT